MNLRCWLSLARPPSQSRGIDFTARPARPNGGACTRRQLTDRLLASPFLPLADNQPKQSNHIFTLRVSEASGGSEPKLAVESAFTDSGVNPAWLARSPTDDTLILACNENLSSEGDLSTLRIDALSGMVIQRISTRKSGATAPCYGSFSSDGRYAFVANVSSDSAATRLADLP